MKPHYGRIRTVKTHSGSTAIQVGIYKGKKFQLIKHIGSSKIEDKITELVAMARAFIRSRSPQLELDFNPSSDEILYKRGLTVTKSSLQAAYTYLKQIYQHIGFSALQNDLLMHFTMMRVLEPASKSKSILLLKKYFDVHYKKSTTFQDLGQLVDLKSKTQQIAIAYAKKTLHFDFSLVFYDVTTLYFETHREDEFRKNGFSKDLKIGQPQVLVGLVVNQTGFPIYYDIFQGNTFEGKTILPVILELQATYQIRKLTVVADAGMLSESNLQELEAHQIDYIVGARLGKLPVTEIREIAKELGSTDQKILRRKNLLFEYSVRRAHKDKVDNDKQVEKARYYLKNPARAMRRAKFIAPGSRKTLQLNEALIEKYRLLEGIKGYRTNLISLDPQLLVSRYKDLWTIEQSFRIAKSDLEARPIYHRKENSIKSHLLIVFMALCMTRVIEAKEGQSIKKVMDDLRDKWTLTLTDKISGNSTEMVLDTKPH